MVVMYMIADELVYFVLAGVIAWLNLLTAGTVLLRSGKSRTVRAAVVLTTLQVMILFVLPVLTGYHVLLLVGGLGAGYVLFYLEHPR
ncbi:hypothetical protein [Prosthecochloris sp. HL-130-GSB]|jgi:hypothetical protein|uniref:hypothetical protein n=1 Tax=Prosthecochloris sp. HL-130-GSB TaxID=1974213 RepID=UPI000A1C081F|nr:hypothetical protein [Prosthecochloris sp. HL-130-GSB]ARM31431.1 hypothetical protein B9H02_09145 [Prosthecochloris sp. HL-130-GSB]